MPVRPHGRPSRGPSAVRLTLAALLLLGLSACLATDASRESGRFGGAYGGITGGRTGG